MRKYFFPHDHKPEHVKSLDGLRGVAVLMVLFAHSHHVLEGTFSFHYYGRTGVYLFFILSAYLLDRQIIEVLISKGSSKSYWVSYTFRRFLRIYPLFFFALMLYYILNETFMPNFIKNSWVIMENLLLIKGTSIFWSIPVEFKYYFISPIMIYTFYKLFKWDLKKTLITLFLLVLFSFVIQIFYDLPWSSTLKSLPAFLAGTLLAVLERFSRFDFKKISKLLPVVLIGIFLSSTHFLTFIDGHVGFEDMKLWTTFLMPVFLVGLFISAKYGALRKLMEWPPLRFIGTISFSVYVFHMIFIIGLIHFSTGSGMLNMIIYFTLTLVFSSITYLLIEYPLSKVRIKNFRRIRVGKQEVFPSTVEVRNKQ